MELPEIFIPDLLCDEFLSFDDPELVSLYFHRASGARPDLKHGTGWVGRGGLERRTGPGLGATHTDQGTKHTQSVHAVASAAVSHAHRTLYVSDDVISDVISLILSLSCTQAHIHAYEHRSFISCSFFCSKFVQKPHKSSHPTSQSAGMS